MLRSTRGIRSRSHPSAYSEIMLSSSGRCFSTPRTRSRAKSPGASSPTLLFPSSTSSSEDLLISISKRIRRAYLRCLLRLLSHFGIVSNPLRVSAGTGINLNQVALLYEQRHLDDQSRL